MVARPGRPQAAFTAGELDPLLHDRDELKYFSTGAKTMKNVVVHPQGGFSYRGGLRDVGQVAADAARLAAFTASDGQSYNIVFKVGAFEAWHADAGIKLDDINVAGLTIDMLPELSTAQRLDTMLVFHNDLQPRRIVLSNALNWSTDMAPLTDIPNYDYGEVYVNGISAEWRLEFVGLDNGATVFTLTVSQQETVSITFDSTIANMINPIKTAIEDLPNVDPGITVTHPSGDFIDIKFDGAGNEGDGWAVTGRVVNKGDAAVLAVKRVVGVAPGEPVISAARGWPACGTFYSQRLLAGGFKSLPNTWMFSKLGDYFNFDQTFDVASGPALVPMDIPGGEKIIRMVPSRNLAIFTTDGEYWLAERGLSRTDAPNHVQGSDHGGQVGMPVVQSEGGLLFPNADGGVIGEFRYSDVEGNFLTRNISLLASHLVTDVTDMGMRKSETSTDGHRLAIVRSDGSGCLATVLREQDVTAFTQLTTDGQLISTAVNGANDAMFIVQRPDSRRIERLETDRLLDEATLFNHPGGPQTELPGLGRFNGREIWVVAEDHVFGPYTVAGGTVNLPFAVQSGYAGTWSPPEIATLPLPQRIGPNIVLKRKRRIHSVKISIKDTTSLAIAANGGPLRNVPLHRYGQSADVPELQAPVTAEFTIRGLRGSSDKPGVTISQLRPGPLTVRSITLEANF